MASYPPADCHGLSGLCGLPVEIIDCILSYLSAFDLATVACVCRSLYTIATNDRHWQTLVQQNVPVTSIETPYPCASFRELYVAHHPRWFLPRYKIWFGGYDMIGRLVLVRYNPHHGCIEGYQMLCENYGTTKVDWPPDTSVIVRDFDPEILIHMDKPVLRLCAEYDENMNGALQSRTANEAGASSTSTEGEPSGSGGSPLPKDQKKSRYAETTMKLNDTTTIDRQFLFARPLPGETNSDEDGAGDVSTPDPPQGQSFDINSHFPNSNVWPPPAVPARQRVLCGDLPTEHYPMGPAGMPTCLADITQMAFHTRNWINVVSHYSIPDVLAGHVETLRSGFYNVDTYATLDPALYTPTAEKPFRGIWVGDYNDHGCEFLLLHQPEDHEKPEENDFGLARGDGESDTDWARRCQDARVYRGRLEAIKLTGDPHVPRGELSFVAEDLSAIDASFDDVLTEPPFAHARIVKGRGHVANIGFDAGGPTPKCIIMWTAA